MELIRKDELLKSIQNVVILPTQSFGKSYTAEILNNIMKAIETAPTVDAVPVVHAHFTDINLCFGTMYECSNCKNWNISADAYCSICGAKMDGGANNGIDEN